MKTILVRLWTTKAQNTSRASLAHFYIMIEQWKTSYSSALFLLYPSRPPRHNAPKRQSIRYLITVLHTPPMEFSIAPATWFCVHILTQVFTMKSKDAADKALTFSFPRTMPCPDGTAMFSILPKLLNSSCPLLQKKNWGYFSSQLKKWWQWETHYKKLNVTSLNHPSKHTTPLLQA